MWKILIKNRGKVYEPIIKDDVSLSYQRGFDPGKLVFEVVKDNIIDFQEGNQVVLLEDNKTVFVGYVFNKSRTGKQYIKTTAYDQIRYLKNKDVYQYEDKTYGELLKMICDDGFLKVGEIEDTGYKIKARVERDKSYADMLKTAFELTLSQTGKEFVLYDDRGKICLKSWGNMPTTKNIITYDNTKDFNYDTSIDKAFNRIKVNYIDDENKKVETTVVQDDKNIIEWGRLQYYAETSTKQGIKEKAQQLLELLNKKHRSLKIKNTVGDFNVRAGSIVPVYFPLIGDISVNSNMLVNSVTHRLSGEYHFMDLEVFNKDIQPTYTGSGAFKKSAGKGYGQGSKNVMGDSAKASKMINVAFNHIGDPYSQGKRGRGNYSDCSYFVWQAMKDAGYNVPSSAWTTASMANSGCFEKISFDDVRPGDVGILAKTKRRGGHTVIALGKDKVIHQTPPRAKTSNMGKYANYTWYRPVG